MQRIRLLKTEDISLCLGQSLLLAAFMSSMAKRIRVGSHRKQDIGKRHQMLLHREVYDVCTPYFRYPHPIARYHMRASFYNNLTKYLTPAGAIER